MVHILFAVLEYFVFQLNCILPVSTDFNCFIGVLASKYAYIIDMYAFDISYNVSGVWGWQDPLFIKYWNKF